MLTDLWLTYRLHRFGVAIAVVALLLVGLSAFVVAGHVRSAVVPASCQFQSGEAPDAACDAALAAHYSADDEANLVLGGAAILAPLVGVLLGVPLVAQELELRTSALAWSLNPSRRRWLVGRTLPMVALVLVGLGVVGLTTSWLADALESSQGTRALNDIGHYGLVMMSRGLLALGIALLAGALLGRMVPALLMAAVLMVGWGIAVAPTMRAGILPQHLVWMTYEERDRTGAVAIAYQRNMGGDWYQAPDSRILTDREVVIELCGADPWDDTLTGEAARCVNELEIPDTYQPVAHLALRSSLESFQMIEAILGASIGMGALLLAFPVVNRRRPT